MKLFLAGATGRTGRWILEAALERGHQVTALVRGDSNRLGPARPGLSVFSGDLLETEKLAFALRGHDAVLSALSSDIVARGTASLIKAAETADVTRFVGLAGGGILQLDAERLRRDRPGYPALFRRTSEGHLQAWKTLVSSSLQWTLFCTPDLPEGPATGTGMARPDYMPETGGNAIPTGEVAAFMLREAEHPKFPCRRVGLTLPSKIS